MLTLFTHGCAFKLRATPGHYTYRIATGVCIDAEESF